MLFYFEMCVLCRNVCFCFGLCYSVSTASLPNSRPILTPWVAMLAQTQHIAAMEASKRPGSEIADST